MFNFCCIIGYDIYLGNYNFISFKVVFLGNIKIGNENMIGINVFIIFGV